MRLIRTIRKRMARLRELRAILGLLTLDKDGNIVVGSDLYVGGNITYWFLPPKRTGGNPSLNHTK